MYHCSQDFKSFNIQQRHMCRVLTKWT